MSLSRRQFFRHFWRDGKTQRTARIRALETYVRTSLLPYDFSITAEQEAELFIEVRSLLEQTPDEDLFAFSVRIHIEELVGRKLEPWRNESLRQDQAYRNREIRDSAIDYVDHFLKFQASPAAIDQLKRRFQIHDNDQLKSELESKIRVWIADVDEEQLLNYDVFTVKDLVFSQLRSWC
jgi:hypothetical protein